MELAGRLTLQHHAPRHHHQEVMVDLIEKATPFQVDAPQIITRSVVPLKQAQSCLVSPVRLQGSCHPWYNLVRSSIPHGKLGVLMYAGVKGELAWKSLSVCRISMHPCLETKRHTTRRFRAILALGIA